MVNILPRWLSRLLIVNDRSKQHKEANYGGLKDALADAEIYLQGQSITKLSASSTVIGRLDCLISQF